MAYLLCLASACWFSWKAQEDGLESPPRWAVAGFLAAAGGALAGACVARVYLLALGMPVSHWLAERAILVAACHGLAAAALAVKHLQVSSGEQTPPCWAQTAPSRPAL